MSNSILHPTPDRLEGYVEGSLDEGERAVLDSHLLACIRCQNEVDELRTLFAALSSLPVIEPSPGFADRVMAGVTLARPFSSRAASAVRRWLPRTTRGWALVAAFLMLPMLTFGGAIAWLVSQPWLTAEGLVIYLVDQVAGGLGALAGQARDMVLAAEPVRWLSGTAESFVGAAGMRGLSAAAALVGTMVVVSTWILYDNLFRTHTRGTRHALYSI